MTGQTDPVLNSDDSPRVDGRYVPNQVRAVLFDRDGTLCVDVPYNGDPDRVEPVATAPAALWRLRAAGVATAVVSNQSGIGRGLVTGRQVDAVNRRLDALLGGLGPILVCPHAPDAGCPCRKPAPALLLAAADRLGVHPGSCAFVGDIGSDMAAAAAAAMRGVLVPTPVTRAVEVAAAVEVAPDLLTAVDRLLGDDPATRVARVGPAARSGRS